MKPVSFQALVFAPASCFPSPVAYVTDRENRVVHTWSSSLAQPSVSSDPPNFLRGWNHVEVDPEGCLYAIVPLKAVLKLSPASEVLWACETAAHHDISILEDGRVLVLGETPRRVPVGEEIHTILDNVIVTIGDDGQVIGERSIFGILTSDLRLRRLIESEIRRRRDKHLRLRFASPFDARNPACAAHRRSLGAMPRYDEHRCGDMRTVLAHLRGLCGSPCDVLHVNTLEVLEDREDTIWRKGDLLVCVRDLDLVAVVDPDGGAVRWWWGPGVLSRPHQPSVLRNGNIMIFDNGVAEERTRILSVDPATKRIEWIWTATPPKSFYCSLAGGCEELPDGHLLVTDARAATAFELDLEGRVVWETVLPASVFGADRGRVSVYRMAAVSSGTLEAIAASRPSGKAHVFGAPPAVQRETV